jgi:hypothetical protein
MIPSCDDFLVFIQNQVGGWFLAGADAMVLMPDNPEFGGVDNDSIRVFSAG